MKVLLLGTSPLPWEETHRTHARGLRTWQLASALASDGHDVTLITRRSPESYCESMPDVVAKQHGGVNVLLASDQVFMTPEFAQGEHDSLRPQCVVAATTVPAVRAADLTTEAPLWIDLFGDALAEGQAKAAVCGDDDLLGDYYEAACKLLDRADAFSTISLPQQHAVVGELGLRGRLSSAAAGYQFVRRVPLGVEGRYVVWVGPAFRGRDVPADAFVVLWSGAYNSWCDVATLFEGLEEAMRQNQRIWFVSTGGELKTQDEVTYDGFRHMAESSRFRERFVFRGWVPASALINYYLEADVGINVDKDIYEVRLGSRGRITDWLRAGLVPVTTRVCELSYQLEQRSLGFTFLPGQPNELSELLLQAARSPEQLNLMSDNARAFAAIYLTPRRTAWALRQWVKCPAAAPDRGARIRLEEQAAAFKSLGEKARALETRGAELEGAVHDKDVHIGNLEDRVTYLEGIVQDREAQIGNLEAAASHAEALAKQREAELGAVQDELTSAADGLKTREGELRQAHDRLVQLNEAARETERKRSEAEAAVTVRERALEDLEEAIDNLKANIELLKQELQRKDALIARLEAFRQKVTRAFSYKVYRRLRSILPGRAPSGSLSP